MIIICVLFQVDGMEVPGALFDFGLLMYHNALQLAKHESGPFFYLPKVQPLIYIYTGLADAIAMTCFHPPC